MKLIDDETLNYHVEKWRLQFDTCEDSEIPNEVKELVEELIDIAIRNPKTRDSIIMSVKSMLRPYPNFTYKRSVLYAKTS